jgi:tight adherence protein C
VVLHSPAVTLLLAACGAAVGYTRAPAQLAQRAEARQRRMRLELVTVDQVLAIHVRAGAGPVQAITRIVERGHGEVVDELRAILVSIRSGRAEAEAFRHAATVTAEPHAARTYRLFALAAEQGADLGSALRALSDDLRDVRRDELRRDATRRRAAMLVPTIAVLAPIMLLFVIAPLPSIVLGGR